MLKPHWMMFQLGSILQCWTIIPESVMISLKSLKEQHLRHYTGKGNINDHVRAVADLKDCMEEKVEALRLKIAIKKSDVAHANGQVTMGERVANSYKEYQRDPFPEYKGDIRDYPQFKREWQRCVAPGRDVDWQLQKLEMQTPAEINLRNCETLEDAWERLDNKYAVPKVVTSTPIKEFVVTTQPNFQLNFNTSQSNFNLGNGYTVTGLRPTTTPPHL